MSARRGSLRSSFLHARASTYTPGIKPCPMLREAAAALAASATPAILHRSGRASIAERSVRPGAHAQSLHARRSRAEAPGPAAAEQAPVHCAARFSSGLLLLPRPMRAASTKRPEPTRGCLIGYQQEGTECQAQSISRDAGRCTQSCAALPAFILLSAKCCHATPAWVKRVRVMSW